MSGQLTSVVPRRLERQVDGTPVYDESNDRYQGKGQVERGVRQKALGAMSKT